MGMLRTEPKPGLGLESLGLSAAPHCPAGWALPPLSGEGDWSPCCRPARERRSPALIRAARPQICVPRAAGCLSDPSCTQRTAGAPTLRACCQSSKAASTVASCPTWTAVSQAQHSWHMGPGISLPSGLSCMIRSTSGSYPPKRSPGFL